MMYQNKLVAAIKAGGKVLRETKESVALPFGSEYSIYLKNLSTVRAMVRVTVDGTDATENVWLVLQPHGQVGSDLELERFIRNGNLSSGNRFKFIERSEAIEQHRGIKAEDGLIRIEYKFEKLPDNLGYPVTTWTTVPNTGYIISPDYCYPQQTFTIGNSQSYGNLLRSANVVGSAFSTQSVASGTAYNVSVTPTADTAAGITVPGSASSQTFQSTYYFPTEDVSHVMVLKLAGEVAGKVVETPITVKHKPTCTTCGRVNKATNKFCSQCGTSLTLL